MSNANRAIGEHSDDFKGHAYTYEISSLSIVSKNAKMLMSNVDYDTDECFDNHKVDANFDESCYKRRGVSVK